MGFSSIKIVGEIILAFNNGFIPTLNFTDDQLSKYLQQVTAFCPYLKPSISAGLCTVKQEDICGKTMFACQEEIFYLCLQETEFFRVARHKVTPKNKNGLLCYNLLLTVRIEFDDQGKELFGWPHYLLKILYTDQAILFGKFWKGEQEQSLSGDQLPIPPVHLFSIRSRVNGIDQRFFEKSPELLEAHIDGKDTGRNVHKQFCLEPEDYQNISTLRNADYYNTVLAYGKRMRLSEEA